MHSPHPAEVVARRRPDVGGRADAEAIFQTVGETPLLELRFLSTRAAPGSRVLAKAEFRNPTGSVKDRAAVGIVREAIRRRDLGAGRELLDASSGNTAVAYAWLGSAIGFPVSLCVPHNANAERLRRIRSYSAEIRLTEAGEGTDGAQREARRLSGLAPHRYFYADQYNNPANPRAHYETTGPEIWRDTEGRVTHLVAGVGTGGTISGTARYLKERNPRVVVVGVEPDGPLHGIEGLKHLPTALRPGTYDDRLVDATTRVETETAVEWQRRLRESEGLTVGVSSGAAAFAAAQVASHRPNLTVVTILPDRGEEPASSAVPGSFG